MTKAERRELSEILEREENLNSQPTKKFKKKTGYNPGEIVLALADIIFSTHAVVLCLVLATIMAFGTLLHFNEQISEQKEIVKANYMEYSFFLDGEPVNYSNIDIDQYSFSVDNETKKVYLTKRTSSSFIPIFIP